MNRAITDRSGEAANAVVACDRASPPRVKDALGLGLLALAYALAHWVAYLFPDSERVLMVIWPAGGIGLAALLLTPKNQWAACLVAIFAAGNLANLIAGRGVVASLGFMTANVVESLFCAWLIRRLCGDLVRFSRVREVVMLLVAATAANACTAVLGAATATIVFATPFWQSFRTWWIGDGLGILIITPVTLCGVTGWKGAINQPRGRRLEACLLLAVGCLLAWQTFGRNTYLAPVIFRPYMLLGVLAWAALRFGVPGAATLMAAVAAIAIPLSVTSLSRFPLGGAEPIYPLLAVQVYLGVMAGTGLLLAASYREQITTARLLSESEDRYAAIFHSSTAGVAVAGMDGRFIEVNHAFCELVGYAENELVERSSLELNLWVDPAQRKRLLQAALRGEMGYDYAVGLRRRAGEIREATVSIQMIELGGAVRLLISVTDITERQRLEAQLRQAQKMESIGLLAGGMAHEFNNILAAMLMNLSLAKQTEAEGERLELLHDLGDSCRRASSLVKQLLAFGRQSAMREEPLDLAATLRNQMKMLGQFLGERVALELTHPEIHPWVMGDQALLEQVVLNLCLNARDAMKNGGRLSLNLAEEDVTAKHAQRFLDARAGRFVRLTVTDTGCGMSRETLDRLFEPFFTTKGVGQGTGLGLATARGLVQQHRGWIEVQSESGRGSSFRIYLPAAPAPARPEPAPLVEAPLAAGSGTILVVEDEPDLRQLTGMLLRGAGYRVLEAANAADALAVWRRHREEIGLLYTDMVMPGELTGLQLAQRMIVEQPGLKVIITSGYTTEEMELTAAAASVVYLPKPCPPELLTGMIARCLS